MAEVGDDSSLYYNLAYPVLPGCVFVTSDGMTEAPAGGKTSSVVSSNKKKGTADVNHERGPTGIKVLRIGMLPHVACLMIPMICRRGNVEHS